MKNTFVVAVAHKLLETWKNFQFSTSESFPLDACESCMQLTTQFSYGKLEKYHDNRKKILSIWL